MKCISPKILVMSFVALLANTASFAGVPLPPADATYLTSDDSIAIVGNDGMQDMMERLNALFVKNHPEFRFSLTAKGSSLGLPALTAGATAIAPLSRELWRMDSDAFRETKGYLPLDIRIGYSGWGPRSPHSTPPAAYIHASNPLKGLTMGQLRRLVTSGNSEGDLNLWSQVALDGDWKGRRIHVYGLRDDGSFATNQRFDRFAGHPWSIQYEALDSREAVISAVGKDPFGIGLVGWIDAAAISDQVRILPLAARNDAEPSTPSYENVAAGKYPLSAYLHLYADVRPGQKLEPFIKAYLEMALSEQGQGIIRDQKDSDEGYVPLSAQDLRVEREKLKAL